MLVKPILLEGSCKALGGDDEASSTAKRRVQSTSGKALTKEPYTCERLTQIRGGYRALTAAFPVLHFDFTNPEVTSCKSSVIHKLFYAFIDQIPLPRRCVSFPSIATGQLDAIAVWFDLHLDSQNSFSTGPSWDISWEQAIFPARHETHLQDGDILLLHASCTDTLLQLEVGGVTRARKGYRPDAAVSDSNLDSICEISRTENLQCQHNICCPRLTTEEGEELKVDDKQNSETESSADRAPLFYVERSELCRWNDSDYIECYRKSLALAVEAVKSGELEREEEGDKSTSSEDQSSASEMDEDLANCLVLDNTHGLSPFGLLAAKEGKINNLVHLSCHFRETEFIPFSRCRFCANRSDTRKLQESH